MREGERLKICNINFWIESTPSSFSKLPKIHPKLLSLKNITWFVCINNGEHEHEHRTSAEHVGGDGEIDGAHGRLANGVGNNWNLQKILIRMRTLSRKKTKESRQVREMIPINSL